MSSVSFVSHAEFVNPLPPDHRFPMRKFGLLAEYLEAVGMVPDQSFVRPTPVSRRDLHRVHEPAYVNRFLSGSLSAREERTIGLPWSQGLVRRTLRAAGGTVETVFQALEKGLACSTAGGTHHAGRNGGAGFCILNDLAVAADTVLDRSSVDRVLIFDCDVHQGDGTARIFAGREDVTTVSLHTKENYPFDKATSDLDVEIPRGSGDERYLNTLAETLDHLRPLDGYDLVLYDAGVDVHREDRLGHLNLTDRGVLERDRRVLDSFRSRGVPVAAVIGGGYQKDEDRLARRHALLHRAALETADSSAGDPAPV